MKHHIELFIIKTCTSNDILVFALSRHMTYIFKKCPSKNLKSNPSNSGPVYVVKGKWMDRYICMYVIGFDF